METRVIVSSPMLRGFVRYAPAISAKVEQKTWFITMQCRAAHTVNEAITWDTRVNYRTENVACLKEDDTPSACTICNYRVTYEETYDIETATVSSRRKEVEWRKSLEHSLWMSLDSILVEFLFRRNCSHCLNGCSVRTCVLITFIIKTKQKYSSRMNVPSKAGHSKS